MRRTLAVLLVVAAGLPGCSSVGRPRPLAEPVTVTSAATSASDVRPAPGPLPAPEALTDVLYRLADPALPGPAKLALVAGASPPDAAVLERFATALRDGGYTPPTFTATDVRWSQDDPAPQPIRVLATVTATGPNPASPERFAFPMEFTAAGGGWQLTRETAEMLFAFGNGR